MGEILEYQNDDAPAVPHSTGERRDHLHPLCRRQRGPFAERWRLAPETRAEAEVLWELAGAANSQDTLFAQFGDSPALPAPALSMLDAAVQNLRECRSVIQVKHKLEDHPL